MRIYSKVENIEDIRRINCIIRDEMLNVNSEAELSELKKRSDYLCTLTYSPFWKKKFQEQIEQLREVAIEENRASVKTANYIAKYKKFDKEYHPWKKEINIEEELKKIPTQVTEELFNSILSSKMDASILEEIRKEFCNIRKAMVVCENVECLNKLKRAVDILSALPFIEDFTIHFENDLLKLIDKLINEEKERSIKLANIIAEVNNFEVFYQSIGEEDKELIEQILEEEAKSDTYIPTTKKYTNDANVFWLVYYHQKRKREYAKRIYLPKNAFDIKIEGPDYYENKFKNKVYGIKISYKIEIKESEANIKGKKIHLPKRIITKTKIIEVPKNAVDIKILDKKPEVAMDIA